MKSPFSYGFPMVFQGPEMPFIGGSEADFTEALQRVDSELAANTVTCRVSSLVACDLVVTGTFIVI